MATVTRQPFAPLDEARLQSLTSQKNRQNAVQSPSGKRKAELLDDFENLDPLLFAKRAKGTPSKDVLFKKPSFVLNTTPSARAFTSPVKATSTPRRTIQPKSPAAKLNTNLAKSSPIAAPAGRSPTQGKRSGILNRRRTTGPFARVNPPSFGLSGAAPFSLDAALKGTIPSYNSKAVAAASVSLDEPDTKASWFFDIHEDTPEQEATNMLQHSTCVLDISSDEESEQKARREKDEGRDKENVPPVDDVSQTSARRARLNEDEMVFEKERIALGEMNTADYYPEGCDESSIVLVPADEEETSLNNNTTVTVPPEQPVASLVGAFEFAPELKDVVEAPSLDRVPAPDVHFDVDNLMGKTDDGSAKAAVLHPIEGTGESFELWESGSSKDEGEAVEVISS